MHKLGIAALFTFLTLFLATQALSHTPLFDCWDNGDGTLTCEGGFSDGSSASGVGMTVKKNNKEIISGQMDEFSEFTFDKPDGSYTVIFDAGEGHRIKVKGQDIY